MSLAGELWSTLGLGTHFSFLVSFLSVFSITQTTSNPLARQRIVREEGYKIRMKTELVEQSGSRLNHSNRGANNTGESTVCVNMYRVETKVRVHTRICQHQAEMPR